MTRTLSLPRSRAGLRRVDRLLLAPPVAPDAARPPSSQLRFPGFHHRSRPSSANDKPVHNETQRHVIQIGTISRVLRADRVSLPQPNKMQPRQTGCKTFSTLKYELSLPFLLELAYDFSVLLGRMRNQGSALLHRVASRPHQNPAESNLQYPNKLQWFVTWLGASVLSLLVLGLLLAMHC